MRLTLRRTLLLVVAVAGCGWGGWILCRQMSPSLADIERLLSGPHAESGVRALQEYVDRHPEDARANYLIGSLLVRTNPGAAVRYLGRVPTTAVERGQAVRLLAALALERQDLATAQRHLDELQEQAEEDPHLALAFTELHLLQGEPEPALEHARRAARLEPARADTWILIAEILDELGRVEESVEPLQHAVELDPNSFSARANLAYALQRTGNLSSARVQLEWCLHRQPENDRLQLLHAEILRDDGEIERAKGLVKAILERKPEDLQAALLLGEILLFEGDSAAALELLEPMFRRHPRHRHLTALLVQAAALSGNQQQAQFYREQLQRQLSDRPAD